MSPPSPTAPDQPVMIAPEMTFAELKENFALFDDWDDRYEYIIDLGRKLPPFPAASQTEANKVRGCMSQVWLVPGHAKDDPSKFAFAADSDSVIVKGLIAVLGILFSGQTPGDVAKIDPEAALRELGFEQHLAPSRRNGLVAMVQKIRQYAKKEV
jgi:cysteine desulfuration protein SufE